MLKGVMEVVLTLEAALKNVQALPHIPQAAPNVLHVTQKYAKAL